jgi:23S rRNA pseudouridine2605 synthase
MRINKFVASSSGLSRRKADEAILVGRVLINGKTPEFGQQANPGDVVTLDGVALAPPATHTTIILNKPVGYVVSRDGQGHKTIFELLPPEYQNLQPVGRLDKDSSGLLLLTNDGILANELTHPSKQKIKIYEVRLNAPLQPLHRQMISDHGVQLNDGGSKLQLERITDGDDYAWRVTMHEGRNRQIRRTFSSLDYTVKKLHRTHFGEYTLGDLASRKIKLV